MEHLSLKNGIFGMEEKENWQVWFLQPNLKAEMVSQQAKTAKQLAWMMNDAHQVLYYGHRKY